MKRLLIIFACIISYSSVVMAQQKSLVDQQHDSIVASHKIVMMGSDGVKLQDYNDSLRNTVEAFYYDQFRNFQDPEAPYFLLMSKDATLAMGLGGAVRMRGYMDWGGAIPASGFAPYLIQVTPDPTADKHFGTTPAGTCLFFRVIGNNKKLGNYQLYIECNFNGYKGRDFHLKKAYAMINDFTIGYASSTFSDPAAVPPTVDAQGPADKISHSSVLVRWMPRKGRWVFAVSAETPSTQIGVDGTQTQECDTWCPDGAAFVQYEWGRTSHVRLAGIVRQLSYRNLLKEKNHSLAGWGLQLSSVAHPLPCLTTYLTASYGRGYSSYCGDLMCGAYDLVGNADDPGQMYAPASYGWCLGLQYNIRPNLFVSGSISQNRYLPSHPVSGSEYRSGLAGCFNIFWNLTPRIQVAAEFDYGRRKNMDGAHRWARRVGAICQFSF